mgnify:CR=1 FL=1
MRLIDKDCQPHCPTSKFLNRKEFSALFPDKMPKRMNFIFKHKVPNEVDDNVGETLLKKYPDILVALDRKEPEPFDDGLDKMGYHELRAHAREQGISHKKTFVKKVELVGLIRKIRHM